MVGWFNESSLEIYSVGIMIRWNLSLHIYGIRSLVILMKLYKIVQWHEKNSILAYSFYSGLRK
jgi:hypothetical protein